MKASFRILFRLARGALLLLGFLALLFAATQFTHLPWRAYKHLSEIPAPSHAPPTHILVMGGSGIPGESGLMRTFFGAQAAALYPDAVVLVAMPLGAAQSVSSRAYLDEIRLRGVASERIRILDGGRNTREQAIRLAEYLADRTNTPQVLIVTDPEHVRRTAASIRKACAKTQLEIQLEALPAFPLSLEDPLPWRAADLDAPGPSPAARAAVPDVGSSFILRYNLWANLGYTQDALREYVAMLYYRLRGWL
jgi:uncharacterized SAM-binding protein YcdF (DUF218 family)